MVQIYCIEDINDLKYVGRTTQTLSRRMEKHRTSKKIGKGCASSSKLDLANAIITLLEECSEEDSKSREQYWIDNTECVNQYRADGLDKEKIKLSHETYVLNNPEQIAAAQSRYYQKNKDKKKDYNKQYREENRDELNAKRREKYRLKKLKEI